MSDDAEVPAGDPGGGRRHLHEARLKQDERTGQPSHEANP